MQQKISLEMNCTCFPLGRFELSEAPYQEYLIKDEDGYYVYDEFEISQLDKAEEIYSSIHDFVAGICDHDNPIGYRSILMHNYDINPVQIWSNIISADRYPNLSYAFKCEMEVAIYPKQIKALLNELKRLTQDTLSVVKLAEVNQPWTSLDSYVEINQLNIIYSTLSYTSYIDKEGFSIVKVGTFELTDALLSGIPSDTLLSKSPKVFNAHEFEVIKKDGQYFYHNHQSGQSLQLNSQMATEFLYEEEDSFEASFKIEYIRDYKIEDPFEMLPELQEVLERAIALDCWIEGY